MIGESHCPSQWQHNTLTRSGWIADVYKSASTYICAPQSHEELHWKMSKHGSFETSVAMPHMKMVDSMASCSLSLAKAVYRITYCLVMGGHVPSGRASGLIVADALQE